MSRSPARTRPRAAVIDVKGDVTPLADDVDLLIAPVWSPDSASIVVRKNTPAPDAAGSFELLLLGRDGSRATLTTWSTASVFPIAFAPDGSKLYFAALNNSGTDLYSIAPDGSAETKIAHLSDDRAGLEALAGRRDAGVLRRRERRRAGGHRAHARPADGHRGRCRRAGRAAGGPAQHGRRARRAQSGLAVGQRADHRVAEPRWRRQCGDGRCQPVGRLP